MPWLIGIDDWLARYATELDPISMEERFPGTFAPWNFRSWNFRTLELSLSEHN